MLKWDAQDGIAFRVESTNDWEHHTGNPRRIEPNAAPCLAFPAAGEADEGHSAEE